MLSVIHKTPFDTYIRTANAGLSRLAMSILQHEPGHFSFKLKPLAYTVINVHQRQSEQTRISFLQNRHGEIYFPMPVSGCVRIVSE